MIQSFEIRRVRSDVYEIEFFHGPNAATWIVRLNYEQLRKLGNEAYLAAVGRLPQ